MDVVAVVVNQSFFIRIWFFLFFYSDLFWWCVCADELFPRDGCAKYVEASFIHNVDAQILNQQSDAARLYSSCLNLLFLHICGWIWAYTNITSYYIRFLCWPVGLFPTRVIQFKSTLSPLKRCNQEIFCLNPDLLAFSVQFKLLPLPLVVHKGKVAPLLTGLSSTINYVYTVQQQ